MTTSEKNIAANHPCDYDPSPQPQPQRKSPKLSLLDKGINASARIRDDVIIIFEDGDASQPLDLRSHRRHDSKENQNQNQHHAALSAYASKDLGPLKVQGSVWFAEGLVFEYEEGEASDWDPEVIDLSRYTYAIFWLLLTLPLRAPVHLWIFLLGLGVGRAYADALGLGDSYVC
ncbi:hypothetical protein CNMCM5793_006834 [Aspergillus hiratsukae]|uniref:Uncharacterized protein n=1 Tax=Aspergillus hiratsukae TaxID=1194566 RepID=A0A8H6UK86_9EURO|nr:hypothetical protein CNMCM5793_006834 [Aspergillus hiratsukae]KAF7173739.1 hypothetical protein CNMCM6106_007767 [Aspergillus hiratsukae]